MKTLAKAIAWLEASTTWWELHGHSLEDITREGGRGHRLECGIPHPRVRGREIQLEAASSSESIVSLVKDVRRQVEALK